MQQVSIADFKAHLSEYLEKTAQGSEITVCKHSRPLAKLVPIPGKRKAKTVKLGALRGTGKWLADPSEPLIPTGSWDLLR